MVHIVAGASVPPQFVAGEVENVNGAPTDMLEIETVFVPMFVTVTHIGVAAMPTGRLPKLTLEALNETRGAVLVAGAEENAIPVVVVLAVALPNAQTGFSVLCTFVRKAIAASLKNQFAPPNGCGSKVTPEGPPGAKMAPNTTSGPVSAGASQPLAQKLTPGGSILFPLSFEAIWSSVKGIPVVATSNTPSCVAPLPLIVTWIVVAFAVAART